MRKQVLDEQAYVEWERAEREKADVREFGKKSGRMFDPRKDALIRHRRRSTFGVDNYGESTVVRRILERKTRRRHNRVLNWQGYEEDNLTTRPRDYKTYGWETW